MSNDLILCGLYALVRDSIWVAYDSSWIRCFRDVSKIREREVLLSLEECYFGRRISPLVLKIPLT